MPGVAMMTALQMQPDPKQAQAVARAIEIANRSQATLARAVDEAFRDSVHMHLLQGATSQAAYAAALAVLTSATHSYLEAFKP